MKRTNENKIAPILPQDYRAVAKTYTEVFAGPPWYEVSKCTQCGSFSGEEPQAGSTCSCGGEYASPAYPVPETTQYVANEVNKPDAIALLIAQIKLVQSTSNLVKGFGWGFSMDAGELQGKYKTQEMQQVVADLLVNTGIFYYVSEVGVLPEMQGSGYGKRLTGSLVNQALQEGYSDFVVRTNEDSGMRYILEQMGMQPIIGLETGIKDTENEARVLFVGKR